MLSRRFDGLLRFLLERMECVDGASQSNGIDGPVRVLIVVFNHFENPSSAEPFQGLGIYVLLTSLSKIEGKANLTKHRHGERPNFREGRAHPEEWLQYGPAGHIMPV